MDGKVLDYEAKRIRNAGIEEGRTEGRAEGRTEGSTVTLSVVRMLKRGRPKKEISKELDVDSAFVDEVEEAML